MTKEAEIMEINRKLSNVALIDIAYDDFVDRNAVSFSKLKFKKKCNSSNSMYSYRL
jgi:hypothetical protein